MIQWAWFWAILVLPLPWVVAHLWRGAKKQTDNEALWVPFFTPFQERIKGSAGASVRGLSLFFVLAWISFVLALMRPQGLGQAIATQNFYRNLMLVLDVSDSMAEQDFILHNQRVSRLLMVKTLADAFLQKRAGDQVGLTLFADEAYIYVPLTPDVATARQMMNEVGFGIAGSNTAMGDALALALKDMKDVPASSKVMILLSDGYANAGQMRPEDVLPVAKEMGVKIYTIGIGGAPVPMQSFFGLSVGQDMAGLDEALLQKIAADTGGQYFRAETADDLKRVYEKLDVLEPALDKDSVIYPVTELFFYPLGMSLALFAFGFWYRRTRR